MCEPSICERCGRPILQLDRAGLYTELVEVDGVDAQPKMGRGRTRWFHTRHRPRHWDVARRDERPEP